MLHLVDLHNHPASCTLSILIKGVLHPLEKVYEPEAELICSCTNPQNGALAPQKNRNNNNNNNNESWVALNTNLLLNALSLFEFLSNSMPLK